LIGFFGEPALDPVGNQFDFENKGKKGLRREGGENALLPGANRSPSRPLSLHGWPETREKKEGKGKKKKGGQTRGRGREGGRRARILPLSSRTIETRGAKIRREREKKG